LAERHWLRRLEACPAQSEHVRELDRLRSERSPQALERSREFLRLLENGELEGRRHDVVRGLPHIDVIVGMDTAIVAKRRPDDLQRPVGDYLVGVHVDRGAARAFEHIDHEMLVMPALDDSLRRP